MVTKILVRIIFFCINLVNIVNSDGQLLVGILGYSNPSNTDYNGKCCSGGNSTDPCGECDLSFRVSVPSFNSTEQYFPNIGTTISSENFSIKKDAGPMNFKFQKWTGKVDIVINVFNVDTNNSTLVDNFTLSFQSDKPDWLYTSKNVTGTKQRSSSFLKVILRYECGKRPINDSVCYDRTCLLHLKNKNLCIKDPDPNNKNSTSGIVLKPTTLSTGCTKIGIGDFKQFQNCTTVTAQTTTTTTELLSITTENTGESTETVSEELTNSITTPMEITTENSQTTQILHTTNEITTENDATTEHENNLSTERLTTEINLVEISTDQYLTTQIDNKRSTEKVQPTTEKSTKGHVTTERSKQTTVKQIKVTTPSVTPEKLTQSTASYVASTDKSDRRNSVTNPPSQPSTSPNDINTTVGDKSDDGAMQYWPGIVGGVLGACLVAAVVSYIFYTRKRRSRKRNNDIYNVNPKRWVFDPPTENGTSGKSEIALETEQL